MSSHTHAVGVSMIVLLALQAFQVAFLWLHDLVPLGRLNDVAAVRRHNPGRSLLVTTLVQSVPWSIGLLGTLLCLGGPMPVWLRTWLWISYGLLFLGELQAWWIPYLLVPDPVRAERYRAMFGATHALLPERHGIRPNTLHAILHAATLLTLVTLAIRSV